MFLPDLREYSMDDPEHGADVLAHLNEQRRTGDLCDVKITSRGNDTGKGNEFMAHMNVLSAASPHFKRIFHSDFKEAIVGEVKLDMDTDIVEFLLEYMYTSKAEIDESIAARLLPEAGYLQLDRLKERCAKFLLSNVTPSNCIEMWLFASLYSYQDMKDLAWKMMCRNFDSLTDTPEFLGLDKKDLLSLLADKSLRCWESSVFSGVCNWVRADPENRKHHMKELFSLVRLSFLEKAFLFETVGKEPLVTENKECFHMFIDALVRDRGRGGALIWKESEKWTDGPRLSVNMKQCSSVVFNDKIYCASYEDQMTVLSQGNWRLFAPPSTGVWNLCVVSDSMFAIGVVSGNVVDGRLMTVGGYTGSDFTNQVYVWNPHSWNAGTPLEEARYCIGATVGDGRLVIAGGHDGRQYKQDVQMRLDGEWKSLPSLKRARHYCGVVVLDNVLYAIGGSPAPNSVEILRLDDE